MISSVGPPARIQQPTANSQHPAFCSRNTQPKDQNKAHDKGNELAAVYDHIVRRNDTLDWMGTEQTNSNLCNVLRGKLLMDEVMQP
jgi:hypothetical protein